MSQRTTAIIFSKDRALQLDGTLASFFLHCRDAAQVEVIVLCKTSTPQHLQQYTKLQAMYPQVPISPEKEFKKQVLSFLRSENTLFLVDDNIFVRDFYMAEIVSALSQCPQALGFSLRLGKNTSHCYSLNRPQALPEFTCLREVGEKSILSFPWPGAECDFGYPLEVSSSVYRTHEIAPLLNQISFTNPNTLEAHMAQEAPRFSHLRPQLLCFEKSVTYCNPINKVQQVAPDNRAGETVSYSAEELSRVFESGGRIDVRAHEGYTPTACHEEVELKVRYPAVRSVPPEKPLISVIIPCYKQAHFLRDAVTSVVAQTYAEWECIIVNDGSPDNTSAVAQELIREFPGKKIRLIEKDNEGLAEARNTGISAASGGWILPLDSDDKFAPTFMQRAVEETIKDLEANIVSANLQCFGARNDILQVFPFSPLEILKGNMFPYASLYRRELWARFGGYIPIIPFGAEDYNFWVTCSGSLKPRRVPEPLFLYRKHEGSSMVDAVIAHQCEVDACLHTCHPDKYAPEVLFRDHDVLSLMHADTEASIARTISKFPQYSQPYFWRGLVHEAKGLWRWARRDFEMAARLAVAHDWQPVFRLALLHAERKDLPLAREAAAETLRRCPQFPARASLEKLIEHRA